MAVRDVVVVGASAGGVEALRALVAGLPGDLPATVLVVLHTPPNGGGALAGILDRSGPLSVRTAEDGEPLALGVVLVARPGLHLALVDDGGRVRVALPAGPRENRHRPAVDVLFRSAARALGPRCVGVVLSGALDDGAAGLVALRAQGGVGVVQDPADALCAGMPAAAIEAAAPEHVVPVAALPALLDALVREDVADGAPPSPLLDEEVASARFDLTVLGGHDHPGTPAGYSCPDCSGALWRIEDQGLLRFRCRVGHAWTAEGLLAQQSMTTDTALWMALRSLEERASLAREMAERSRTAGRGLTSQRFDERAHDHEEAAEVLRRLLVSGAGDAGAEREAAGA